MDIETVSFASCTGGLNWVDAAERVRGTVVPVASCGVCGSTSGHYADGENVFIFGRNGGRESTVFDYHCVDCSAVSGPTTAALYVKPGEPPRHVVSIHIADADVFLQRRKPRQRA